MAVAMSVTLCPGCGDAVTQPAKGRRIWCSQRCRKRTCYGRLCPECGTWTAGSEGGAEQDAACLVCLTWTEENVIAAMRRWADEHGGIPPTTADWRGAHDGYPVNSVHVIRRVGWNELLLRAGFQLRKDRRPETQERMEAMLREGRSTRAVAEHFGCTANNVHQRLRYRGRKVSELRAP